MKRKLPDWLPDYFDDYYLKCVLEEIPPERTLKQVEFVLPFLPNPESGPLLDVGCGIGRHTLLLAKRGFQMVGIDVIPLFIHRAEEEAEKQRVLCQFRVQDVRLLEEEDVYAGALFFWSSFGYFEDEENLEVLLRINRALKPEGFLFLDLENRDYIIRHFQNETWKDKKAFFILERNRFDPTTDLLITRKIYVFPGGRKEAERRLKLYPFTALTRFLKETGFAVERVFGGWNGEPFNVESQRMMILARKKPILKPNEV
ncbi:MAG: class I SAM-dependent methyltransferase [Caldiserica bacterium]|nr:class I SAM-dependent methyltransferase [Caldisericota bacterium]